MPLISYAQNREDVLLHRVLSDVERGFYIDVGANDPEVDSVTKAFYDVGWHGINVEPVAEWHRRLVDARPRDVNLQVFAAEQVGTTTFFEIVGTGLSTSDASLASKHRGVGYEVRERAIATTTLDRIADEHSVGEVHFLKIDVEGAEEVVLRGLDLARIRPWVVLVEATRPLSTVPSHDSWEPLILGARYRFVHFDGLSRFYLAEEHAELADRFAAPANVHDDFVLARVVEQEAAIAMRDRMIEAYAGHLEVADARTKAREVEVDEWSRRFRDERQKRLALGNQVSRLTDARRTDGKLVAAYEKLLGDYERILWTKALVQPRSAGIVDNAGNLAAVEVRRRLRKARKFVKSSERLGATFPGLESFLESAAAKLPESVPKASVVVTQRDLASSAETHDPSAIPANAWLPPSIRAQVALRARLRKVRKFLKSKPLAPALKRRLVEGLDLATEVLPSRVGEQMSTTFVEDLRELRRLVGLGESAASPIRARATPGAPRVLVLSTYPFVIARHGGQIRLANVVASYERSGFDVVPIAVYEEENHEPQDVGPLDVPFPADSAFRWFCGSQVPLITDILSGRFACEDGRTSSTIDRSISDDIDLIHLEQPWLLPLAKRLMAEHPRCRAAKLVYGSQNIEVDLKRAIFRTYGVDSELALDAIEELERAAARAAAITFAVTEADQAVLAGMGAADVRLASNGISPWVAGDDVIARFRARLGDEPFVLYVASAHPPNFTGFVRCVGESLACIPTGSKLVVAGSVGPHLEAILRASRWHDLNLSRIEILGILDDEALAAVKLLAHAFIVPIEDGGGSNIKSAEALFSGYHVVMTTAALRGFDRFRGHGRVRIADEPRAFQRALREVMTSPPAVVSGSERLELESLTWDRSLAPIGVAALELVGEGRSS